MSKTGWMYCWTCMILLMSTYHVFASLLPKSGQYLSAMYCNTFFGFPCGRCAFITISVYSCVFCSFLTQTITRLLIYATLVSIYKEDSLGLVSSVFAHWLRSKYLHTQDSRPKCAEIWWWIIPGMCLAEERCKMCTGLCYRQPYRVLCIYGWKLTGAWK